MNKAKSNKSTWLARKNETATVWRMNSSSCYNHISKEVRCQLKLNEQCHTIYDRGRESVMTHSVIWSSDSPTQCSKLTFAAAVWNAWSLSLSSRILSSNCRDASVMACVFSASSCSMMTFFAFRAQRNWSTTLVHKRHTAARFSFWYIFSFTVTNSFGSLLLTKITLPHRKL